MGSPITAAHSSQAAILDPGLVAQTRDRLPAFGARVRLVSTAQFSAGWALLVRARPSGLIQPLPGSTSLARTWTGSPARFLVGWILTTQARPNGA